MSGLWDNSQSVKTVGASKARGIDGGKNERPEAVRRCRRHVKSAGGLSKDYEMAVSSAETIVKISHTHTLLKRL